MNQDARASLTVGAFVLTALVGLGLGILSLSAESGLFQPQYRLIGRFQNVLGLLPGAPVWLGGKEVGRVDRIAFQAIDDERPVLVVMRINEDVQDRIRADSQASIGTIGLLGDSYVEISFGTEGARVLIDGDEIGAADPVNVGALMSEGRAALASISELSSSLNAVVQTFAEKEGAERAVDAIEAASDIMIETREGNGLIHSLIFEPYDGGGADAVASLIETTERILGEVEKGDGLLHSLIYAPAEEQSVLEDASDALRQLTEAGGSLNRVLAKMDAGDGTIGLLLNDPSVYEDLKVLLGGAQRSTLLRSMIRMAVDEAEETP